MSRTILEQQIRTKKYLDEFLEVYKPAHGKMEFPITHKLIDALFDKRRKLELTFVDLLNKQEERKALPWWKRMMTPNNADLISDCKFEISVCRFQIGIVQLNTLTNMLKEEEYNKVSISEEQEREANDERKIRFEFISNFVDDALGIC